jgi:hypothetical protein
MPSLKLWKKGLLKLNKLFCGDLKLFNFSR